MDRDAHTHSDITRVDPAGPESRTHRLTVGDLHVCRKAIDGATHRNGHGEVSRGRSSLPRPNAEGRPPRRGERRAESFNPRQYRNNSMDEQRQQRTEEAATLPTGFWEMLEKLTPKTTRPDPDGEEVVQTVGNPPAEPVHGEPRSSAAKDRQRALTRTSHGTGVRGSEPQPCLRAGEGQQGIARR